MKNCLAIMLILLASLSFADDYTRSYKFSPIHIETDNLLKAAYEIYLYVENINGVSDENRGFIKLGRDDFITKVDFPFSDKEYEKFPRISYEANISIENYDGIISSVNIWLDDDLRKVEVTGKSHDHVTGLIKVVQEKFSYYNVTAGGRGFRMIIGLIFILLFSLATVPIWIYFKDQNAVIIYILFLILMNVLIHIPPWELVFPGFIAGVESRSFLEKHAALFTFLGFAVAVIVPILTFFARYLIKKPEPNKTNSADAKSRAAD